MDDNKLIKGIKRYSSNDFDILIHGIGVFPDKINKNVLIAPWWEPSCLPDLGQAEYLSESQFSAA